jgi:hypothetical protein
MKGGSGMKYLIIGLMVSIGWHVGMFIVDHIGEVLSKRWHRTKAFKVLTGKPNNIKSKTKKEIKAIGFR